MRLEIAAQAAAVFLAYLLVVVVKKGFIYATAVEPERCTEQKRKQRERERAPFPKAKADCLSPKFPFEVERKSLVVSFHRPCLRPSGHSERTPDIPIRK